MIFNAFPDFLRFNAGNIEVPSNEVLAERSALREEVRDYDRAKRAFGPEQVAAAVEADKQREQAEKASRRPRRACDRDGR